MDLELKPVAKVQGEVLELPADLYIPPEYLEILLETFEGPLDLLLYLIRKKNFDILNIPIKEVTDQYLSYLDLMKHSNRDIAIEYLVMAGTLIEIKSRLLLPRHSDSAGDEELDPRLSLAQRLLAYEECQRAALALDSLEKEDKNFLSFQLHLDEQQALLFHCCKLELHQAYFNLLKKLQQEKSHTVEQESLSVREAMIGILDLLHENSIVSLQSIFKLLTTKHQLIVYFLAILQMAKDFMVNLNQEHSLGPIYVQRLG